MLAFHLARISPASHRNHPVRSTHPLVTLARPRPFQPYWAPAVADVSSLSSAVRPKLPRQRTWLGGCSGRSSCEAKVGNQGTPAGRHPRRAPAVFFLLHSLRLRTRLPPRPPPFCLF